MAGPMSERHGLLPAGRTGRLRRLGRQPAGGVLVPEGFHQVVQVGGRTACSAYLDEAVRPGRGFKDILATLKARDGVRHGSLLSSESGGMVMGLADGQ